MSSIDDFADGDFVAVILPLGGKAVGVVKQFGTGQQVQYVSQSGTYNVIDIKDVEDIAELIINWEASIN